MAGDMSKIIEISLAKIENSKSKKVIGKSNLHRNLLVNTLLNRVRSTDKTLQSSEKFMDYREPKSLVDIDEYDTDGIPQRKTQQYIQSRKQSLLVTNSNCDDLAFCDKNNSNFMNEDVNVCKDLTEETKENKFEDSMCGCISSKHFNPVVMSLPRNGRKRNHSIERSDECCSNKKLRCLQPSNLNNVEKDTSHSITRLASLFGGLVANTSDSKMTNFHSNIVSKIIAC